MAAKPKPKLRQNPSGSWKVYFRRGGKQHWRSFKTLNEAERYLAEVNLRRARSEPEPSLRRIKFAEFSLEWQRDYARPRVSPATYRDYETALRVHLIPELGHLYLHQIDRRNLVSLIADWTTAGPHYQERVQLARDLAIKRAREEKRRARSVRIGYAPKTISNAIVPLREMLGHAVEWGYLSTNPAHGLKRPRNTRRNEDSMHALDVAQVRRLLAVAEPGLERCLIAAAVQTGLRQGKLRALRWKDIDRDHDEIHVCRSIGLDGVQLTKTAASDRKVALPPTLGAALLALKMASRYKQPDDLVFASENGTALDPANIRRRLRGALDRAGVPRIRFHDLRHTYASLLVAQNAHPKLISVSLGHASIGVTMDRYSHLFRQTYTEEAAKLDAALFGQTASATDAVSSSRRQYRRVSRSEVVRPR